MPAPLHHNTLANSDLQHAHLYPGDFHILQSNSAMSAINRQLLCNSSASTTTTTDHQFNQAVRSNSTYHGYDAVPTNIYNGGMYSVDENTPAGNGCMNPSNGYPAYGSRSNSYHSNGLALGHNDSFTNLSLLNDQTSRFNEIKPSTSNGCNDWSVPSYSNDWSSNNYSDWSTSEIRSDCLISNSCNVQSTFNNCNDWSAFNGHNGMPVSNGCNDWSPSPYSTYNSQHTSLMGRSRNTSPYHGYCNSQNPPFFSSNVPSLINCYDKQSLTPVNGINSLYPPSDSPYYKVAQDLSVQSSQISSHTNILDRNPQSNKTFLSSKSSVQASQIPEHFVANNINRAPCGRYPANEVSNCGILPSVYNYPTNSSQSVNLSGDKKKSKGKRGNKNTLKKKDKSNDKSIISVDSKATSHKPNYQECGPDGSSDSTNFQEPAQGLITRSKSSSCSINESIEAATLISDPSLSCKDSTANKRSATTIWKKLLNQVHIQTPKKINNLQAGSKSDFMLVKILNHNRTKVYFGSRKKPVQIPTSDKKPTVIQSLNIPTDPIEAEYVAKVERFRKIQENKKSLLEQLLLESSNQ